MREGTLAYGFLRNLGEGDALLFLGDRLGVERLAQLLRDFASAAPVAGLRLDDPSLFERRGTTRAVIELADADSSAEATVHDDGRFDVTWSLSIEDASECADRLDALASADDVAHQYLETAGDIQIVVSIGEYEPSILDHA
jgi:hypothetical protein